jgi:ABC-type sugar transport system permease subunit
MTTTTSTRPTVRLRTRVKRRRQPLAGTGPAKLSGLPWVLPAFIFVVGIVYYSVAYTGYISTLDWDGLSPTATAVGLGNFTDMLADPIFWASIQHTAIFWVVTFTVQTALGFVLAAIMHSRVKFPTLHKVIIFVPTVLAPATMAPVFRMFFADDGMANDILRAIGLDNLAHSWLADATTALPVLMLITVWQWTGLWFLLYYAAMSQIEPELIEAARLDRAGNLRALWHIVWPGCRGTTVSLAMLSFIGALKTFDIPYLVTTGGPYYSTEFLGTYIYRIGIRQAHIGYAAAISIVLLVLAVAGAIIIGRLNRKEGDA